jgi:hypothetical protein
MTTAAVQTAAVRCGAAPQGSVDLPFLQILDLLHWDHDGKRTQRSKAASGDQRNSGWAGVSDFEPALENARAIWHPIHDLTYPEALRSLDAPLMTADCSFMAKIAGSGLARYVTLLSDRSPA